MILFYRKRCASSRVLPRGASRGASRGCLKTHWASGEVTMWQGKIGGEIREFFLKN